MPSSIITVKRVGTSDLRERLDELEHKYGMPTSVFLNQWSKGELDGHDYVLWASLSHLAIRAGLIAKQHAVIAA